MDDLVLDEKDDDTNILYLPVSKPRTHLQKEITDAFMEKRDDRTVIYLPGNKARTPLHKELRVFLEEEQKASEAGLSANEEQKQDEIDAECAKEIVAAEEEEGGLIEGKIEALKTGEQREILRLQFPAPREPERDEEDEESRRQRGKGNIEKWIQMLWEENTPEEGTDENPQHLNENENSRTDEIIRKLNLKYPPPEIKVVPLKQDEKKDGEQSKEERVQNDDRATPIKTPPYKILIEKSKGNEVLGIAGKGGEGRRSSFEVLQKKERSGKEKGGEESRSSFEVQEKKERKEKEKGLGRSDSFRAFRRIPSSPSLILGMKKGVDCIRKKPSVIGDDDGDEDLAAGNNFIKSSIKTIKKAVKM